ncbi:MAG: hypothetical protein LBJ00_18140 [Planctomycetaceae bacterium]|nr:hypothetical protein [Planctomycetaceae bacterium]
MKRLFKGEAYRPTGYGICFLFCHDLLDDVVESWDFVADVAEVILVIIAPVDKCRVCCNSN